MTYVIQPHTHARTQNTRTCTQTLTHAYMHEPTHEQARAWRGKGQAPLVAAMTAPYLSM